MFQSDRKPLKYARGGYPDGEGLTAETLGHQRGDVDHEAVEALVPPFRV
jgi:hypothetical protein